MYKRIARYVHPDKNAHERATEAFQKLLSSWRHPLPSLPSPSHLTFALAINTIVVVIVSAVQILVASFTQNFPEENDKEITFDTRICVECA
jgi:hypothetical protein